LTKFEFLADALLMILTLMLYHGNRSNVFVACALWYYYCYE